MADELSDKVFRVMRQLGDMPLINAKVYPSKDGKYIINEVRIKTIKPTNYYAAIINNKKTEPSYDKSDKGGDDHGTGY